MSMWAFIVPEFTIIIYSHKKYQSFPKIPVWGIQCFAEVSIRQSRNHGGEIATVQFYALFEIRIS